MFEVKDDLTIYCTRGDVALLSVTADENGVNYIFQPGDVVRMKVFEKKDCQCVVMQKDVIIEETTDKVDILLTGQETRICEVISKPKDFWYEVELNPETNPQTIIGYDEDGPKVFKMFPEGKEFEDIGEEDIPFIDSELSTTSRNPVENRVITAEIETLKKNGGGKPPMFELIGSWYWQNIDMRLDPSYDPAIGNAGSIGKYLEVDIGEGWTIINPYRATDPAPSNTRIARYTFPEGKAYKKVIVMMSFDPNFIPRDGETSPLEYKRGFKVGAEYGQKSAGDPVYSSVRFLGDMGGTGTLLRIDSHNKDSQGFVKVLLTKEEGLWTLTRTERTDNTGNRSDLRHYQSGFYGSYDAISPNYHESPYDASVLGSYERITGFEFETILPWYDTDNSGGGDKLNNLRGMLSLYGVPEDDPETVYGLKFYNINVDSEFSSNELEIICRLKQYKGGVVCATLCDLAPGINVLERNIGATVKTVSGTELWSLVEYKEDVSHSGETRAYLTFDMPDEDVVVTLYPKR